MVDAARTIAPGLRVLCVDDESMIGELVAKSLRRQLRCEVVTVASGNDALAAIGSREFDLVIVDYLMPAMDGGEVYRNILARRPDLARRLLFITGDTLSESTLTTIRDTGQPLLAKPFGVRELESAIRDLVG